MSQEYTDKVGADVLVQLFERARFANKCDGPHLHEKDKAMIRNTWSALVHGDPSNAGLTIFMKMFDAHPETKNLFDFARGSSASQMKGNTRVLFHVTRVAQYLDKVVNNLDNLEDVVAMLKQAGGRHSSRGYNVTKGYLQFLGDGLVAALGEKVPGFSPTAANVWKTLYAWINKTMQDGMDEYNTGSAVGK